MFYTRLIGDMPHAWAYAMYILLLRNLLVYDLEETLRIGHGVDPEWLREDNVVEVDNMPTKFGLTSFSYIPSREKEKLLITIRLENRHHPKQLFVHVPKGWKGKATINGNTTTITPQNEIIIEKPPKQMIIRISCKAEDN